MACTNDMFCIPCRNEAEVISAIETNETSADGTWLSSFNIPLIKFVILKWHAHCTNDMFYIPCKNEAEVINVPWKAVQGSFMISDIRKRVRSHGDRNTISNVDVFLPRSSLGYLMCLRIKMFSTFELASASTFLNLSQILMFLVQRFAMQAPRTHLCRIKAFFARMR